MTVMRSWLVPCVLSAVAIAGCSQSDYDACVDKAKDEQNQAQKKVVEGVGGGIITYWRRLANNRGIGWQFQDSQLRFQITVEDRELQGKTKRAAREAIVEAEHVDFFDHAEIEQILGPELRARSYATGKWLGFNPDFVYRHRPVKPTVSTAKLAEALAAMTERVDDFADRTSYNVS